MAPCFSKAGRQLFNPSACFAPPRLRALFAGVVVADMGYTTDDLVSIDDGLADSSVVHPPVPG